MMGGTPVEANVPAPPPAEGMVIFSGGEDHGPDVVYVNPTHAVAEAVSEAGEVTILEWWIKGADSEYPLFEDQGGDVENVLAYMVESAKTGEFWLYYRMQCPSGHIYRFGRNFYLLS